MAGIYVTFHTVAGIYCGLRAKRRMVFDLEMKGTYNVVDRDVYEIVI